jgi:hypothetical protein
MGKKLRRKLCDGTKCNDPAFFGSPAKSAGVDPFFKPTASADAPAIQKEGAPDAPKKEEEKKDPLVEGLKITGEQLFKHEPFKLWFKKQYAPLLGHLKADFWDHTSGGEKALLLSYAGINLGTAGLAFAQNPELRKTLSGVNIGAPLGWIPYSPIEGFKYKLPEQGKTDLGLSADFTLNPYLELWKNRPGFMPSTATFGLESSYDLGGKGGFNVTGGNFKLGFLDDALSLKGSIFSQKTISPYPLLMPGTDGMPPSWIMKELPGMPDQKTGPGAEITLNADLWKMSWFRRVFGQK